MRISHQISYENRTLVSEYYRFSFFLGRKRVFFYKFPPVTTFRIARHWKWNSNYWKMSRNADTYICTVSKYLHICIYIYLSIHLSIHLASYNLWLMRTIFMSWMMSSFTLSQDMFSPSLNDVFIEIVWVLLNLIIKFTIR